MPVIRFTTDPLSVETKKDLIKRLTETAVEVTHIPPQAFTVVIDEKEDHCIGVAGISLEDIKAQQHN